MRQLSHSRRRQVLVLGATICIAVFELTAPIGVGRGSSATLGDPPRLAFVNGSELRVVAADGSGERSLAIAGAPVAPPVGWDDLRTPAWSPDNQRVAFSRSAGISWFAPKAELRIITADGQSDTTVLSLPGLIEELSWSPTGERLAFALFTPNPAGIVTWGAGSRWDVYVVNADGTGLRLVAPLHASQQRGLDWSPDGTRLALSSDELGVPGIYTVNVDGPPIPTRVTPPAMIAADPRWSPDGQRIAFRGTEVLSAGGVLTDASRLWTVKPDGTDLRELPASTGYPPSWSADSGWLAYSYCYSETCGIAVISADGSTGHLLTSNSAYVSDNRPVWSKHGKIAFVRNDPSCCRRYLWVIDYDGSGAQRVSEAEDVGGVVAWSR